MQEVARIPKLIGSSNYDIWSIRIEAILVEKGYLKYILSNPATINSLDTLEENAYKATALIKLALEDGPLLQTQYISNPYILWHTLLNLYKAKGFSSEFLLSKELINTTLNSYKGNIEDYINSFKRIINSLEARNIILPSKFVIALLLNNLNKDYEFIVASITQSIRTSNSNTISLDSIITQLLDESRRLKASKDTKLKDFPSYKTTRENSSYIEDNSSLSSSSSYSRDIEMSMPTNKTSISNSNITCYYCNKKGHIMSKCLKKKEDRSKKAL